MVVVVDAHELIATSFALALTVQVSGILQTSYEIGNEPSPACAVDDAEDAHEAATPDVSGLAGLLAGYGAGSRTVTCSYTDGGGLADTHSVSYTVVDTGRPTLGGGPTTLPNTAGWYNTDVTIRWAAEDSGVGVDPAAVPALGLLSVEGRDLTATASVQDRAGNSVSASSSPAVNIDKTAPRIDSLRLGTNPRPVSQASSVVASAADDLAGVVGGEFFIGPDPGRGKGIAMTVADGQLVSSLSSGLEPGVHTVSARAVDGAGNWSTVASEYLVVYDPNGGFVTGGGRIDSPRGAFRADGARTGGAAFGFVSRYQRGATVPAGNTEFQFHAGDLSFSSSSYEWLVISGAKAQYKGQGSLNGQPGYTFVLTATDGEASGGGGVDKLRIKIWNAGGVVYDNGGGAPDDLSGGQALASGSIVIHR